MGFENSDKAYFDDNRNGDSESLTFNYLDLTLLARANIPLERDASPYLVAVRPLDICSVRVHHPEMMKISMSFLNRLI